MFKRYSSKDDPGRTTYYRHAAFVGNFRRFEESWFLEIVPTYRFTVDGYKVHPYYETKLKGIKAQEHNQAVFGQVSMWADLLQRRQGDLFAGGARPALKFGPLRSFQLACGIDDREWLATDDAVPSEVDWPDGQTDLFEDDDED